MLNVLTNVDYRHHPTTDTELPGGVIWYDLLQPTLAEEAIVSRALGIELPTQDEMREIELSARLYHEDGAEFMTALTVTGIGTDDPVKSPVTFVLKGATLVTIRHVEPKSFEGVIARSRRTGEAVTAEGIMLALLDGITDRIADALERTGDEIDAISKEIFRKKQSNAGARTHDLQSLIDQIGLKGEFLGAIRESLVSISRLLAYHVASTTNLRKDAKQKAKLLQRDATSLGEHASFLSDKTTFLLDATLGLINLQQNQIIKIFSVAAVAFLPPTLVASIYGMNFDHMPELHFSYGYPMALGLMVLSAVLPCVYFKRRGWL